MAVPADPSGARPCARKGGPLAREARFLVDEDARECPENWLGRAKRPVVGDYGLGHPLLELWRTGSKTHPGVASCNQGWSLGPKYDGCHVIPMTNLPICCEKRYKFSVIAGAVAKPGAFVTFSSDWINQQGVQL